MPTIKKRGSAVKIQQEQEIVTLAHKVQHVMAGYQRQLRVVVIAAAVVLVMIAGYAMFRSSQEQKAAPLVAAAYEFYSPATGTSADYGKALDLFRDVQKKYPNTTSGAVAQYYVGNCLVSLGRADEALKEYQAFISKYSRDKYLRGLVYQRMAYVYEGQGKLDDARKAFEQAEALTGPGVATVELARLYEAAGNMPEAEGKYKIVMEKLGGTTWSMDAMGKVQKVMPAAKPGEAKATK